MSNPAVNSDDRFDALAALRRFAQPRKPEPAHRCELCGAALVEDHQHLWAPAERQLQCACDACAFLFPGQAGGRFRRVPRDASVLHDFRFDDATWNEFRLPIELAFFVERENPQRVVAAYPSPGGAVEADVEAECWRRLIELNPVLATVEREVEALLVHRIGASRRYYRVPIDVCFQLVGLIRKSWRGLGGGPQVWGAIDEFFNGLDQRASRRVGGRHA